MPDSMPDSDLLAHAAVVAGSAPSIHNTQPWRWDAAYGLLYGDADDAIGWLRGGEAL
jgi:hypothetical protein